MATHYEILGLNPGAGISEVKTAFRRLAKLYHPDKNPGDKAAEEKFKEAAEAYEILSDADKKARYDQYGHAAGDQVLKQTTSILRETVRDSDTIIRWGGEEFLLLINETNPQNAYPFTI